MGEERREFSRVAVPLHGALRLADGTMIRGEVHDVSVNGVFLVLEDGEALAGDGGPDRWLGAEGDLQLCLGEGESAASIEGRAMVARAVGGGLGLKLVEVELESYHHLCALVLHNAEHFEAAQAEIQSHAGLRKK